MTGATISVDGGRTIFSFMIDNIYFIAEIGINHNGDISVAKKLIDQAKSAALML